MAQSENDVNGFTLSLFIGESFAEAFLTTPLKKSTPVFHRWYLGKEGLRGGLQRFLSQAGVEKINRTLVASRFLEKIFSYRLGGSVATVTTAGFESWPSLRQPASAKTNTLSSADLVFAVPERCNAQGEIEKELSDETLSTLLESLKGKQAKRVCIHFLNAHLNPQNQNRLQEILLKENFEVYVPPTNSNASSEFARDEVGRWRKNILNASVSGTFEEVQAELNLALVNYLPEGHGVQFLSSEGQVFEKELDPRLGSLWGASYAWTEALRKKVSGSFDVLYLGLDQFSLFYPGQTKSSWQSPWGKIDIPHVKSQQLSLQPTTGIELNSWGVLDYSATPLGYEPGPMFMGRGQVPTLLDLWAGELTGITALEDRRSAPGMQKFKNNLWALNKTSTSPLESEEKLQPSLRELALQKLAMEIQVSSENKKLVCMGTFAPLFFATLKKRLPQQELELRPEAETVSLLMEGANYAV